MKKVFLPFVLGLLVVISGCQNKHSAGEGTVIGIFGGMGPAATAELYRNIVELTPAKRDQEHLPTLIYSQPKIPDRIVSIREQDPSILPWLEEGVKRLEQAGASFIAIPCNTVHYYFDHMQQSVNIPIIHMIRETVEEVKTKYPEAEKIGLLATTATLSTGLYGNELIKQGYAVVVPPDSIQEFHVMQAVFGIKAGLSHKENEDHLVLAAGSLEEQGADLIILGCTEIPLAFNSSRTILPVVDASRVLAERCISLYNQMEGRHEEP